MNPFEIYFQSVLKAQGKLKKLLWLYSNVLFQSINIALPELSKERIENIILSVFIVFQDNVHCSNITSSVAFESTLMNILFSKDIEPFYERSSSATIKETIKRQLNLLTEKRKIFYNNSAEQFKNTTTSKIYRIIGDLKVAGELAEIVFDEIFFQYPKGSTDAELLSQMYKAAMRLLFEKGYDLCAPRRLVAIKPIANHKKVKKVKSE